MEMTLKIYKNDEQVNEIKTGNELEILKNIKNILHSKEILKNAKTKIYGTSTEITEVIQQFNNTGIDGVIYKYIYEFKGV